MGDRVTQPQSADVVHVTVAVDGDERNELGSEGRASDWQLARIHEMCQHPQIRNYRRDRRGRRGGM